MTILEHGKFIKNFVRDPNGNRIPHSNWRGYSKADIEKIKSKIDDKYWSAWEVFLKDKKNDKNLQSQYKDYSHYLYALNSISDTDIIKYNLPKEYLIIV